MATIPSIAMIPSGYKTNKVYSVLPTDGGGDLDFARTSTATRITSSGLIEEVGIGKPRLDYSDGGCPNLLIEPSSTNNLVQSNQFDTTWVIGADALDLTSGQSGAYGSNDAWLLKKNSSGSRYIEQSLSLSSSQYSYSVYLKPESTDWVFLEASDGTNLVNSYFDLKNGVVGTTSGTNLDSATMYNAGNGWYRCTLTYTQATSYVRIFPANANESIGPTADNGIFIQYSQVEGQSSATSYIPTTGTAISRTSDTASKSGISSLINSSEGVLFVNASALVNGMDGRITISDGTLNNRVSIEWDATANTIKGFMANNGEVSSTLFNQTDNLKIALSYKENDFKLYINGFLADSDSSANVPSAMNKLYFSNYNNANPFYGKVKDLRVYSAILTDAELRTLTTI